MIKGNHRLNGFITASTSCGSPVRNMVLSSYFTPNSLETHDILNESEVSNVNSTFDGESLGLEDSKYFQIKDEPQDDFEHKTSIHSIIEIKIGRQVARRTLRDNEVRVTQAFKTNYKEQRRTANRSTRRVPRRVRWFTHSSTPSGYDRLVAPRMCDITNCRQVALPCTRYCTKHIMHNKDQVLFSYCTAKFADNTQCSVPVFDITHELPLCPEHARKRDNYKMYQETKPKKLRKKVKPSAMIRPQKRSKKKKKSLASNKPAEIQTCNVLDNSIIPNAITQIHDDSSELAEDMVEQVLAMQEPDVLELPTDDQVLVTQAGHLLEESDITNVLNTIQPDEFNDFFTVNRNGEYEPTREETEELERALAAVDNDVKSLEKLSQTHGLLDSLLDEHTLVESLVQIPDMFHNGYGTCGDGMVVGQTSRLLPVEPHSQH